MSEYVLLTSTDRYRTVEENPALEKVAEYQYYFFGKLKSTFTLCKMNHSEVKIRIQGVSETFPDNLIPLRVFPKFNSLEEAEKEIYELDKNEESKIVKNL